MQNPDYLPIDAPVIGIPGDGVPARAALIERISQMMITVQGVRSYLPSNYTACEILGDRILIIGSDEAGWTLDGYVIPRLASGLITATEI